MIYGLISLLEDSFKYCIYIHQMARNMTPFVMFLLDV